MKIHNIVDYITEPDLGESTTMSICYTAVVHQALNRSTAINIDILEQGNYIIDNSLVKVSPQSFIIPADLMGKFNSCVNMTVTGNGVLYSNIMIVMLFTAPMIKVTQCMIDNNVTIYKNGAYYGVSSIIIIIISSHLVSLCRYTAPIWREVW